MSANTHPHPTNLKSYARLLEDGISLIIQAYGQTGNHALGFKGSKEGIEKWHNLFSNFDTRPRDPWKGLPPAPSIRWLYDTVAFINLSKERLRSSLYLYFYTNIALDGDAGVKSTKKWDEEAGELTITQDEESLEKLAHQAADHFIETHIHTHCFVPETDNGAASEYNTGCYDAEESDTVEVLADRAIS